MAVVYSARNGRCGAPNLVEITPAIMTERRAVVLEMRDACESCAIPLPVDGPARICSYECTFCEPCAGSMRDVCPNCGGELVARPRRAR